MSTFIFIPRCIECREPAAVVDEGKYFCGSCFLERTLHQHVGRVLQHAHDHGSEDPRHITSRAS